MTFLKSLENMFRQRTPSREQAKSIRPTMDGKVKDTLYWDMYHLGQSKKAPKGYTLLAKLDGITGVSSGMVMGFPRGIKDRVFEEAIMTFGVPVISPSLKILKG